MENLTLWLTETVSSKPICATPRETVCRAQLLVDIIVWKPSRFSAESNGGAEHGRFQLFLWCPFELEAAECGGGGWSEGRERAMRCLDALAHTKLSPSLSPSRYWQTALPRHPPTLFRTCYVEYSVARKIFFRLPRIDERKIRHVARESRYLLCNLRKVEAIPPFPEFWWHMGGFGINRFGIPRQRRCKRERGRILFRFSINFSTFQEPIVLSGIGRDEIMKLKDITNNRGRGK